MGDRICVLCSEVEGTCDMHSVFEAQSAIRTERDALIGKNSFLQVQLDAARGALGHHPDMQAEDLDQGIKRVRDERDALAAKVAELELHVEMTARAGSVEAMREFNRAEAAESALKAEQAMTLKYQTALAREEAAHAETKAESADLAADLRDQANTTEMQRSRAEAAEAREARLREALVYVRGRIDCAHPDIERSLYAIDAALADTAQGKPVHGSHEFGRDCAACIQETREELAAQGKPAAEAPKHVRSAHCAVFCSCDAVKP